MARKGRHPRRQGRVAPRANRPTAAGRTWGDPEFGRPAEPELLTSVRRAVRSGRPLDLLLLASGLLTLVDPRCLDPFRRAEPADRPPPTLDGLVESFRGVARPETSALLMVIAALAPGRDDEWRTSVAAEVARRGHRLPAWLDHLAAAQATKAVEMVHVLGDGDNVVVGVDLLPDHHVSAVVYIDHNMGTVVKDAFVVPDDPDGLVADMRRVNDDPGTTFRDIDAADARARIVDAVDDGARTWPPFETDTWPACRPLVEWVARLLPAGGTGYRRREWTDAERDQLAERFLGSPPGARHRSADHLDLLDALLWYGTGYGTGDPLRWSPVSVEIVLADWIPRKIVASPARLRDAPDVLRDLIRFGHGELGIPGELTEETLAAVDAWEPAYQAAIRSPRLQGADALLAAVGVVGHNEQQDELSDLTDEPLPDEDVDWARVPDDIAPEVGEVVRRSDRWCETVGDMELRTAARRLVAVVAAGDPGLFGGRPAPDRDAAAVCWLVGHANGLFDRYTGTTRVKDLVAHFGVPGNPSQRGRAFMRAAGLGYEPYGPVLLGADMLTSARRRRLIAARDRVRGDL
jgi:hypothetical protein